MSPINTASDSPSRAALADPAVRQLLASLCARVGEVAPRAPLEVLTDITHSWAISQAMAAVVAHIPTLASVRVHMDHDTGAVFRGIEDLALRFDGGVTVADLESPEDWDLDADLDGPLRRLADQLAMAAPSVAAVCAAERLQAFADVLDPLLELVMRTKAPEYTVERPAAG